MSKKEYLNVSGDLKQELMEISNLRESTSVDEADLFTVNWSAFLTLFCC